jgi:hypothetical protein
VYGAELPILLTDKPEPEADVVALLALKSDEGGVVRQPTMLGVALIVTVPAE